MNLIDLKAAREITKADGSKMIFRPGRYNMQGSLILEQLAEIWLTEGFEVASRPGDEEPLPPLDPVEVEPLDEADTLDDPDAFEDIDDSDPEEDF